MDNELIEGRADSLCRPSDCGLFAVHEVRTCRSVGNIVLTGASVRRLAILSSFTSPNQTSASTKTREFCPTWMGNRLLTPQAPNGADSGFDTPPRESVIDCGKRLNDHR